MKRYWLFVYHNFLPQGGARDFHGSYDTLDDVDEELKKIPSLHAKSYHIFDTTNQEVYVSWCKVEFVDNRPEKPFSAETI